MTYTVHTLDGRYISGPREADSHEAALVNAAERDSFNRIAGITRPESERYMTPGQVYIVSDVRGPEGNGRVKALRLVEVPRPAFTAAQAVSV